MRSRTVLAAVLLSAACNQVPRQRDPSQDLGVPVLGFAWKTEVADHHTDKLPQEFAAPAALTAGDEERVYVGTHGGMFYSLDGRDGEVRWKRDVGAVSTRPLLADGRIYLGTDDGLFLVLDVADGDTIWRYQSKGAIQKEPVLIADMVVFSTDKDLVEAIDRGTGQQRWRYERDTPEEFTVRGHAGVATDGDLIFAGFADGHLVGLNPASGEVVWVKALAGEASQFVDVDTTPVVAGDVVYAASSAGGLWAHDVADGAELWHVEIPQAAHITIDGAYVFVAAADAGLYALDRRGNVLWRQGFSDAGDPAQPVVTGSYLLVASADAGLFVINKASGKLLQVFDPGKGVSSVPTVSDDRLYFLSNGGFVYAFNLRRY